MREEIKSHKKTWVFLIALSTVIILIYKVIDSIGFWKGAVGEFIRIISPVLWGFLIAYLLYMPERKIEKSFKRSKNKFIKKNCRKLGIITAYIIVFLLIVIIVNVIWPVLIESVNEFVSNFQTNYTRIIKLYNDLPADSLLKNENVYDILRQVQNIDLKQYLNLSNITGYLKGALDLATSVFDIFVAVIVSIYVLLERDSIIKYFRRLIKATSKPETYEFIDKYFKSSNKIFFRFIESQFIDAILVSIITSIAMKILGVRYAVLLGFMIGLFNMIPYFGAIVAVVIAGIVTLMTGGVTKAIIMLIVVTILQQIDANIINPKIVGNSLKLSPILIIIAVTIGGAYFGIIGMFLSVPVVAILKILLNDYIDSKEQICNNENEII